MRILAIDTALPAASACVFNDETGEIEAAESLPMERGHAEALLPLIDRVMARVDGGFTALGKVAVTVGPGSFTGLRVGVAAARAIALACEVPVVGVSTLAALAAPLIIEQRAEVIAIAIDARHANVFFALFGPGGRTLAPPRIASLAEAASMLAAAPAESGPPLIAGSGAALLAAEAERRGVAVDIAEDLIVPDIAFVAKLGLLADPALAPARPLYLKPADAKPTDARPLAGAAGESPAPAAGA